MSAAEPRNAWEQRLLEERARVLAAPRTPHGAPQNVERVIVCAVADALFGIAVADVMRVTPFRRPARLPDHDSALLGLSAHSGRYYRIFDLTALLQGASGPESGHLLLLRRSMLGVRIDAALDIADVKLLDADAAPQIGAPHAASRGYARGLEGAAFEGRLITLLDISKLFAGAQASAHGEHTGVDL